MFGITNEKQPQSTYIKCINMTKEIINQSYHRLRPNNKC